MKDNPKISRSCLTLDSRLGLTLRHMDTVNKSLSENRADRKIKNALAGYAIKRNLELAIQLVYIHLNEYLRSILNEMCRKRPLEIVGKSQNASLSYHEIIKFGNYEKVCRHMADRVFRDLSDNSRGTKSLVKKIISKTGVQIENKALDEAEFYMEVRHLIVHNSGIIDSRFEQKYRAKFKYCKAESSLPMSLGFSRKAIESINDLCHAIDSGLISKSYVDAV